MVVKLTGRFVKWILAGDLHGHQQTLYGKRPDGPINGGYTQLGKNATRGFENFLNS
jgi:hypothetical protein